MRLSVPKGPLRPCVSAIGAYTSFASSRPSCHGRVDPSPITHHLSRAPQRSMKRPVPAV
jgi:hypothetical protein